MVDSYTYDDGWGKRLRQPSRLWTRGDIRSAYETAYERGFATATTNYRAYAADK